MIYKFRAECRKDALDLIILISTKNMLNLEPISFFGFPDVEVEIELETIDLDGLRELMREVPNGHVMVQTVMPIEEYTGERNYEL